MSRLRSFLFAAVAAVSLTVVGCTDSGVDPNADKTTLLTNDTWRTTKYTVSGTDMLAFVQVTTKFNADGTYTATNAGGDTESGTWTFNVDETNIEMTEGSSGTINWEVRVLSSTSLKLRSNMGGVVTEYEGVPN